MQIFKSRKLIIGLAIGLGVVLLAGIVTALFFLFRSPGGQEDTPAGKTESEAGEQTEDEDTKVWLFDFCEVPLENTKQIPSYPKI